MSEKKQEFILSQFPHEEGKPEGPDPYPWLLEFAMSFTSWWTGERGRGRKREGRRKGMGTGVRSSENKREETVGGRAPETVLACIILLLFE